MFNNKTILTFLSSLFFVLPVFAQQEALEKIDTTDLKKHLLFIASDELQGRKIGTAVNGLDIAADYIANHARHLGLTPGAPGFFQKVDLFLTKPDESNFIEIINDKGKSQYLTRDLVEINHPDAPQFLENIPVVFAGFGEKLTKADVKDKAVVVSLGTKADFLKGSYRWRSRNERLKTDSIAAMEPTIILIVSAEKDKNENVFKQLNNWYSRERFELAKNKPSETDATMLVKPDFADELLGGKGEYNKYLTEVAEHIIATPEAIKKRKINVRDGRLSIPVDAKNVVAVLEGDDPELKEECIVFMAHYDHLGMDENGEVYNGADDNGSGTATIMEVAEAFAALEEKPKRSIVFLWVTGEELGMLGSEFYTSNPVFSMEKTKACFNLDMVGRVFEPRDTVWNKSPKLVKDFDGLFTLSNDVWPGLSEINQRICEQLNLQPDTTLPSQFLRSSDHYHFHKNNVPIINYATGYHADYHKISDEIDKVSFAKMKRVAELCFLVGLEVANLPKSKNNSENQ